MSTEEDKQCDHCGKFMSEATLMLHENHCRRNYYKCECGEFINKRDKETHEEEMHTTETCPNCKQTAPQHIMKSHDCPKKPRTCDYCEATILFDLYTEHRKACGNRTRQCTLCQKYIPIKDIERHEMEAKCLREQLKPEPVPVPRREEVKADRYMQQPVRRGKEPAKEPEQPARKPGVVASNPRPLNPKSKIGMATPGSRNKSGGIINPPLKKPGVPTSSRQPPPKKEAAPSRVPAPTHSSRPNPVVEKRHPGSRAPAYSQQPRRADVDEDAKYAEMLQNEAYMGIDQPQERIKFSQGDYVQEDDFPPEQQYDPDYAPLYADEGGYSPPPAHEEPRQPPAPAMSSMDDPELKSAIEASLRERGPGADDFLQEDFPGDLDPSLDEAILNSIIASKK